MRATAFGRALCVTLVTALALLVASPPPAAAVEQAGDGLTTVDLIMQLIAQAAAHLAKAGFLPQVYTFEGSFSGGNGTASVASVNGTPSASFSAALSGSSQFVSGTASYQSFGGTGANRRFMNAETWADVHTQFSGPGSLGTVIEDLKLLEIVLGQNEMMLQVTGAQIETSAAGVLERKAALSFAYAIERGRLRGRGHTRSFVPGNNPDRTFVFGVAGDVQMGAGNFDGMGALLRAEEQLLLVTLTSDPGAGGEVTLSPADVEGKTTCTLPGSPDSGREPCGFIYKEGEPVEITSTPDANSKHDRWGDLCTGKAVKGLKCKITIAAGLNEVSANYDVKKGK
jgi:hypothetical protein